jgi:flagellar hook-basal body complex protein FliE
MNVEGISGSLKILSPESRGIKNNEVGFGDVLGEFVKQVNQDQITNNKMLNDFVTGNGVELHEVMVAGEKAKTSLDLLMQIRNKAIDMYRELTRMS